MKGKTVCTILNKIAQTSNKYDDYSNFQRTHTPHSSSPISTSTSKPTSSLPYQKSQQPTTHTRPRIQTRITAQFSNDFVWVGSKIKKNQFNTHLEYGPKTLVIFLQKITFQDFLNHYMLFTHTILNFSH